MLQIMDLGSGFKVDGDRVVRDHFFPKSDGWTHDMVQKAVDLAESVNLIMINRIEHWQDKFPR